MDSSFVSETDVVVSSNGGRTESVPDDRGGVSGLCCFARRNPSVAAEVYVEENSALHEHLLRSERDAINSQPLPGMPPPSTGSQGHGVNNLLAQNSESSNYYSAVLLNHSLDRRGPNEYEHYDFSEEAIKSDAELLPNGIPTRNGVSTWTKKQRVGGTEQRYETMTIDSKQSSAGGIYETVATEDRVGVRAATCPGNYEVDDGGLTNGKDGSYENDDRDGSHGYAYAVVESRRGTSESVGFRTPAKDVNSLYAQFEVLKMVMIKSGDIKLGDFLGSGQFGTVYKGEWSTPKRKIEVAVKTLHQNVHESEQVRFLQEAAIMGQFDHDNVIKMYGMVNENNNVMIVLEYLPKGDLRQNLIGMRSQGGVDSVLPPILLKYCKEIAIGMRYLSEIGFVHRDLAARNILVSGEGTCKVADFGMARDLAYEDYYISHGGQIPVKWTAPEALHYKKYSTASDVWSFGAVMYEIWSLGHKPFENCTNNEVIRKIDKGIRLAPPPGCPRAIYSFMMKCWNPVSSKRPLFLDVVQYLFLDEKELLKWTVKEKSVHISACWLGVDLEVAKDLHKDLQELYSH